LQRAFHIGGARNVIASLWKVNDEATAALMNLLYYHLWEKNEPPLMALHHAQLDLYRHPRTVPGLAKRGAIDFDETVREATKAPVDARETAAVRDWAAFVLSGAGRRRLQCTVRARVENEGVYPCPTAPIKVGPTHPPRAQCRPWRSKTPNGTIVAGRFLDSFIA
jgi:hypothetical protein